MHSNTTPAEVLANLRKAVESNFRDPFGPYRMPNVAFACDEVDAIEPYDLQRASEPMFNARMRHWLVQHDMHCGRVSKQLNIDRRIVVREMQKMRLEDPDVMACLREELNRPGRHDHAEIASRFNIAPSDVEQVAKDMLLDDPAFLELFA